MGEIWLVVTVRVGMINWVTVFWMAREYVGWIGGGGGRFEQVTKAMSVGRTYFVLQPLRLLLRFERHKAVALADASPVDDDFRGLDVAVRGEHATQFRLGCVATERTKRNVVNCKLHIIQIPYLIPPTKIRFGINVPYLGTDSGASSCPAAFGIVILFMLTCGTDGRYVRLCIVMCVYGCWHCLSLFQLLLFTRFGYLRVFGMKRTQVRRGHFFFVCQLWQQQRRRPF